MLRSPCWLSVARALTGGASGAVFLGAVLAAAGCATYRPEPVDLAAHARAFAERLPDSVAVAELVARLRDKAPATPAFDPDDGLVLAEVRVLALLFHPDLRAARLRAGVAQAGLDYAARWPDPELRADLVKILESVTHPWLAAAELGFTLPITGRLGLERGLAAAELRAAWTRARVAEARVLGELDACFAAWSAARVREKLLADLLDHLRGIEAIALRLAAAGEITRIDARTFTLERVSRAGDLLVAQAAAAGLEMEVRQLAGLAPSAPVVFTPSLEVELRVEGVAVRGALLDSGPRLATSRVEHEVAEHALELAVREQWPELSLFPGWQEEDAQPRVGIGFALPLPLWNGNVRSIAEARAARALAGEIVRGGLERATLELARAELRLRSAVARRAQIEDQLIPLVELQVAEGRRLVELGELDTLLLLDGLVRAHRAGMALLDATLEEARAAAQVNSFSWPALGLGGC